MRDGLTNQLEGMLAGKLEVGVLEERFVVYYDTSYATGDDGHPVIGDVTGEYQVVHCDGSQYGDHFFDQYVGPHGTSGSGNRHAKQYAAKRVAEAIVGQAMRLNNERNET